MKHPEFTLGTEPMALVPEQTSDGDRIQREREQSERDRNENDKQQERFA